MHEDHRGHETMHLEIFVIALLSLFASQLILMAWKRHHFRSYQLTTLIGMWLIPLFYSLYSLFIRFVAIWVLFSLMTGVMVYLASRKRISPTTPRRVYWWFLWLHKVTYGVTVIGYMVVMLTIFGVNLAFLIPASVALDVGFLLLAYGIYYGVISRDFAEVCTDKMAAHIGYSPNGIPTHRMDPTVCMLCMNLLDSNEGEQTLKLNCSHVFHDFCLRGWCIVGKKDICPYCKEKVNLKDMFTNPWEKPHILFGNLLDGVRYLIAWQPLLVFVVQIIIYLLGLK